MPSPAAPPLPHEFLPAEKPGVGGNLERIKRRHHRPLFLPAEKPGVGGNIAQCVQPVWERFVFLPAEKPGVGGNL